MASHTQNHEYANKNFKSKITHEKNREVYLFLYYFKKKKPGAYAVKLLSPGKTYMSTLSLSLWCKLRFKSLKEHCFGSDSNMF